MRVGDGTPGPGRPKGSSNKVSASFKALLSAAIEERGGLEALLRWAEANETEFYRLAARLIPTEVQASVDVRQKRAEELSDEELVSVIGSAAS